MKVSQERSKLNPLSIWRNHSALNKMESPLRPPVGNLSGEPSLVLFCRKAVLVMRSAVSR